jgi:hypothetical protein
MTLFITYVVLYLLSFSSQYVSKLKKTNISKSLLYCRTMHFQSTAYPDETCSLVVWTKALSMKWRHWTLSWKGPKTTTRIWYLMSKPWRCRWQIAETGRLVALQFLRGDRTWKREGLWPDGFNHVTTWKENRSNQFFNKINNCYGRSKCT